MDLQPSRKFLSKNAGKAVRLCMDMSVEFVRHLEHASY